MGVAEVVEANAREAGRARHDAIEDLGDGLGVEESTACVEEHPVVGAVGEPVAGEAVSPPSENGDGGVVEVDAATTGTGLDVELDGSTGDVLQCPTDRYPLQRDVEVGPVEADDLTATHTGERGEVQGGVEPLGARRLEEIGEFLDGPGASAHMRGTPPAVGVASATLRSRSSRRTARSSAERRTMWTSCTALVRVRCRCGRRRWRVARRGRRGDRDGVA